jgi:hypothetical protein
MFHILLTCQLHPVILVQQNILRFDIAVDDGWIT